VDRSLADTHAAIATLSSRIPLFRLKYTYIDASTPRIDSLC
jgi:hypothetical protein